MYSFKVIVLGDFNTGKSSIIHRYCYNSFDYLDNHTVGMDIGCKTIDVDDEKVNIRIWDTSGQETYKSLISSYFKDVDGVVVVFSFDDHLSKENINYWLSEFKKKNEKDIPIVILGNKLDLPVTSVEMSNFDYPCIYTSAKTGRGIDRAFNLLINEMIKNKKDAHPRDLQVIEIVDVSDKRNCCHLS